MVPNKLYCILYFFFKNSNLFLSLGTIYEGTSNIQLNTIAKYLEIEANES